MCGQLRAPRGAPERARAGKTRVAASLALTPAWPLLVDVSGAERRFTTVEVEMPEPNPVEAPQLTDPEMVPLHRRLDCGFYDTTCLMVAFRARWHGFSCNRCECYQPEPPMPVRIKVRDLASEYAPSLSGTSAKSVRKPARNKDGSARRRWASF